MSCARLPWTRLPPTSRAGIQRPTQVMVRLGLLGMIRDGITSPLVSPCSGAGDNPLRVEPPRATRGSWMRFGCRPLRRCVRRCPAPPGIPERWRWENAWESFVAGQQQAGALLNHRKKSVHRLLRPCAGRAAIRESRAHHRLQISHRDVLPFCSCRARGQILQQQALVAGVEGPAIRQDGGLLHPRASSHLPSSTSTASAYSSAAGRAV